MTYPSVSSTVGKTQLTSFKAFSLDKNFFWVFDVEQKSFAFVETLLFSCMCLSNTNNIADTRTETDCPRSCSTTNSDSTFISQLIPYKGFPNVDMPW